MTEDDEKTAIASVTAFLESVRIGDAERLWDGFSEKAQAYVLNLALKRGMDFDLASRLRDGTASPEEVAEHREHLLEGIRRDLGPLEFDSLEYDASPEPETGQMRVTLLRRMDMAIGTTRPTIPVGSLLLSQEAGGWKVDRLNPRPGPSKSSGNGAGPGV